MSVIKKMRRMVSEKGTRIQMAGSHSTQLKQVVISKNSVRYQHRKGWEYRGRGQHKANPNSIKIWRNRGKICYWAGFGKCNIRRVGRIKMKRNGDVVGNGDRKNIEETSKLWLLWKEKKRKETGKGLGNVLVWSVWQESWDTHPSAKTFPYPLPHPDI